MARTIGLNDGPYLIMTITFEEEHLVVEDYLEARIPRLVISPSDTIAVADFLTSPPHRTTDDPEILELVDLPVQLTVTAQAYGKRFNLVFEQTTEGNSLSVESSEFSVKAWFTSYADQFFSGVLTILDYKAPVGDIGNYRGHLNSY